MNYCDAQQSYGRLPTGRQSKHPPHTQVGCRRQAERAGKLRGMKMLNRNLAEQKRHNCTKLNRNARNRTLFVTTRNRQRNRNDKLQRDHSRRHSRSHYQRIQQPIDKIRLGTLTSTRTSPITTLTTRNGKLSTLLLFSVLADTSATNSVVPQSARSAKACDGGNRPAEALVKYSEPWC